MHPLLLPSGIDGNAARVHQDHNAHNHLPTERERRREERAASDRSTLLRMAVHANKGAWHMLLFCKQLTKNFI